MSNSELKDLLEQITLSYEAAQRALTSPSIVAIHEFINKRMEEIALAHGQLVTLVGVGKGMELTVKTMSSAETTFEVAQEKIEQRGENLHASAKLVRTGSPL